jgi:required for meiotic nuclear division protein 1
MASEHRFHAVAFPENFVLKDLAKAYPAVRAQTVKDIHVRLGDGEMSLYPFGAVAFRDVAPEVQAQELERLRKHMPRLSKAAVEEDFLVKEGTTDRPRIEAGTLAVDHLTDARAEVVALIVAQSAAMEYYERIVDGLFANTDKLVDDLERLGTVTFRVRRLHRFIGQAVGTRGEVLSILHLLDKPDATWDDPAMDRIYDELRAEFDLVDRYHALEAKLTSVQEALELVLDVARDRRLFAIEASVMLLIVFEIVISLVHD